MILQKFTALCLSLFLWQNFVFSQFPGAGNAIDFQNNREIIAPTGADLNPSATFTDLTVETWVYWRGQSGGDSGIMEGRGSAFHLEITDNNDPGRLRVRVNNNNGGGGIVINGVVPKDEWVHLAFTYENSPTTPRVRIYKNGELIHTENGASGAGLNFDNWLRFGISCCTGGSGRPFNGLIDEIRVWYKAKTAAEIRAQMCKKLTLPQTDLTLYYRLDEIVNDTVYDLSGNGNHGLTNNITPATHLVTSGAPIGDESDFWHGIAFGGNTYYHQSNFADSLSVSNITGNPDGLHIYSVDGLPNTLTGTFGVGSNAHYYGVFMANDAASYDATYHYGNNPAFLASAPTLDENDIVLYNRGNNTSNLWMNSGASPIVANQTITTNNVFRQEYIIGLENGEALPIELFYFSPSVHNGHQVKVNWITSSERNNDFFTLERSKNGFDFEEIATVKGAGNSVEELEYSFIDESPYVGVSYYRLKQTDFDGSYSYSSTKSTKINSNLMTTTLSIHPNPSKSGDPIKLIANKLELNGNQFNILDLSGKLIKTGNIENNSIVSNLPSGFYFIEVIHDNQRLQKRFVVQ